ncbi:hypothetical protein IFM89_037423 [Coptis chinensis]|uniref:Uncharacterized protein n=1 Tax=Coptis chinensis TaxID=261450 RepID=A0A835IWU3_9MAGN|nr:hypothetical protein IFM89_037423 [Coptis chinensis]
MAKPKDIEWIHNKNPISTNGVETIVMYMFQAKKLVLIKPSESIELSLEPFTFELLTVSPVKIFSKKLIQFVAIGLVNMLNTGEAIQSLSFNDDAISVQIGIRGTGEMRLFASEKPKACKTNGEEVVFKYEESMVVIQVEWPSCSSMSLVEYLF